MHRLAWLLTSALAVTIASPAAATPTAQLVYSRDADADSCPDDAALRRAVSARIGYDPFFPWAKRTVVASIHKRAGGFRAQVYLVDEQRTSFGARELSTKGGCGELLDAVALTIAIAIDPDSAMGVAPPPTTPPPAAPEPPAAVPEPPPPAPVSPDTPAAEAPVAAAGSESPRTIVTFQASLGVVASVGSAPGPSVGGAVGGGLRTGVFSLEAEGVVDAPATNGASGAGEASAWRVLGALVPCAHVGALFGCAVGEAGSVRASSNVAGARSSSFAFWGAGGRVGGVVPLATSLGLRLRLDVVADLDRHEVRVAGDVAWRMPPATGTAGVDVVWRFP